MIELKFDAKALFTDLVNEVLIPSANEAMEHFYNDAITGMRHKSKDEVELKPAHLANKYAIEQYGDAVVSTCAFYGWALFESYGRGEEMDWTNEALYDYIGGKMWNPIRPLTGKIVGRVKGKYTNFFGDDVESNGTRAGKGLGGWGKPVKPKYMIQNAELRLDDGGYLNRILDRNTENFFEAADLGKYFTEVYT